MNLIPENINLSGEAELKLSIDQTSTINLVTAVISIIAVYFVLKRLFEKI